MTDTVEKVFWGWRTKFSRAADALRAQRCAGPRRVSEKRPRTFASALGRISTMELSKNQHLRDFWHRSIFDFFNTIDPKRTSGWRDLWNERLWNGRSWRKPDVGSSSDVRRMDGEGLLAEGGMDNFQTGPNP